MTKPIFDFSDQSLPESVKPGEAFQFDATSVVASIAEKGMNEAIVARHVAEGGKEEDARAEIEYFESLVQRTYETWQGADDRLWAKDARGWDYGVRALSERLQLDAEITRAGTARLEATFARIIQNPEDPRLFDLAGAEGGVPAALFRLAGGLGHFCTSFMDQPTDVLAIALKGNRFWRATGDCFSLGQGYAIRGRSLLLCQDAHGFVREMLRFAAGILRRERAGREAYDRVNEAVFQPLKASLGIPPEDEGWTRLTDPDARRRYAEALKACGDARARAEASQENLYPFHEPNGFLILDPLVISWKRRGWLDGIEEIEILDAPATGALGRALRRLNPLIGGPRGVDLRGVENPTKPRAS